MSNCFPVMSAKNNLWNASNSIFLIQDFKEWASNTWEIRWVSHFCVPNPSQHQTRIWNRCLGLHKWLKFTNIRCLSIVIKKRCNFNDLMLDPAKPSSLQIKLWIFSNLAVMLRCCHLRKLVAVAIEVRAHARMTCLYVRCAKSACASPAHAWQRAETTSY